MTLGFRIAPSVWTVLAEAQAWYEDQRSGLGTEFMAAVEGGLDDIRRAPEQWPIWRFDRPYRKRVLGRFPYVIFYVIEHDAIVVLAVAHTKRRPGHWLDSP
jgi:plasmid stabilization system protein ParE